MISLMERSVSHPDIAKLDPAVTRSSLTHHERINGETVYCDTCTLYPERVEKSRIHSWIPKSQTLLINETTLAL